MQKVPFPCYEVNGNWFLNINLFLIKPFLIAKFDCMYIAKTKALNTEKIDNLIIVPPSKSNQEFNTTYFKTK